MVPRRDSEPLVEPVALPLPAGRVSVRGAPRGERGPQQARSRVRAARFRHLRRRPLLGGRGALRQGRRLRRPSDDRGHERGARRGHTPRAADSLVPQHVGLGHRRRGTRDGRRRHGGSGRDRAPVSRRARARGRRRPRRSSAEPAVLRQRDEHGAALRARRRVALPEGRDQRPCRRRSRHRQPRAPRLQGGLPLPRHGAGGGDGGAAPAAAARGFDGVAVDRLRVRRGETAAPRPTSSTPS